MMARTRVRPTPSRPLHGGAPDKRGGAPSAGVEWKGWGRTRGGVVGVAPLTEILSGPFAERYAVPAINVFNDLTMEAVLAAAVEKRSPLIVQTSVKTVKSIGSDVLYAM